MKRKKIILFLGLFLVSSVGIVALCSKNNSSSSTQIIDYIVDPQTQNVQLYWKNDRNKILKNIQNLKSHVESKNLELQFATNGGMFKKDFSPVGLLMQNKKTIVPLDTSTSKGNFYLKPNGVFYITVDNIPKICKTEDFINTGKVKFATQSGPMLLIDGQIHPSFTKGSTNVYIRNGVGVLPNNKLVFAMSKSEINFYDFAVYFKNLGCKNALFFDGFVSRTYLPEKKWVQTDGNLGVMVGVTRKK